MATSRSPSFVSRTRPTKLASPPMSVRLSVNRASSAPTSKSSRWTRITSASRHRRKERDLVAGAHGVLEAGIFLIDRDAKDLAIGERGLVRRALIFQPIEQLADGGDVRGRRDFLGRQTPLAA